MTKSPLDGRPLANLLFLLPSLIIYVAFIFGPIVVAVGLSFTDWNGLGRPVFVGIANYTALFRDPDFLTAMKNNAVLMIFYCLVPLALGMVLASVVSAVPPRERLAVRTLLFLPYIMPSAVIGIVWRWLYNPLFGPINQGLKAVGLGALALPWLGDFTWALPAVGFVVVWYYFGFCMVIFMTGLQRLDPSLYEASRIDGAGPVYTFRRITFPLLLPEVRIVLLLTIIASIKSFDLIFTMTRGGPANATLVPNIYMYEMGFQLSRFGYAAAVAVFGAAAIFAVNYAVHRAINPKDGV